MPDPEVPERPARSRFTAEYKLRIVEEANAATEPGAVGALLRREGLYSSHLVDWRRRFFIWHNEEHRHSGIGLLTPAIVHAGQGPEVRAARAITLDAAYAAHPERFVRRPPTPPELPVAVWINKPIDKEVPPQ